MEIFNEERRNYYRAKKREIKRREEASRIVKEDALFVYHYGMSAYLELFPEAKGFGINWHRALLAELQLMEKQRLGNMMVGYYSASAATKDKKANRRFVRTIKEIFKKV